MARSTPGPRDRIMTAATDLFSGAGVRAVGVDTIIATAGVAKASFYHHFPSKDALVVAWLRADETRWLDEIRARADATRMPPRERLLNFFTVLEDHLAGPRYNGCAYLNTAAEFHDQPQVLHEALLGYIDEVEAHLRLLVTEAGVPHAEALAQQLHLLIAGAMTITFTLQDRGRRARGGLAAARTLIEAAIDEPGAGE